MATEVSRANTCPYCVDVHQATLQTLPPARAGTTDAVGAWARTSGLRPEAGSDPAAVPFPAEHAPEIYGVAVVFHYINRMVHLFLAASPVPEQAPGFLRGTILRTAAKAMRPASGAPLQPGVSLDLLPEAPLPAGLDWARGNLPVAQALGRAVAAVTDSARWVPPSVRELLDGRLAEWDGTPPPGPGRAWVEEAVTDLPDADRPAARLALLTAFTPYQVLDADIAAFRERHAGDQELIELTSWAALSAALCVGGRFAVPSPAAL
ncbi:alkylhydroperoxidase [Streptomyces sp. YC537]|uniref:Alkylhydroperoxidase n=1 Tax=Streptomyces boluensis TaxID=1775135 RepID=A0A964UMD1_9ACTN|nr:alkylhydroperoxidase [Streptomyces boluensis]